MGAIGGAGGSDHSTRRVAPDLVPGRAPATDVDIAVLRSYIADLVHDVAAADDSFGGDVLVGKEWAEELIRLVAPELLSDDARE